jgi:GDPmannose 4,6-dehydratase
VRYFKEMKKALVTGATGQDGIYLTQLLVEKGYEVTATTSQPLTTPSVRFLRQINPSIKVLPMSILESESILETIAKVQPDEIYNLASISSVAQSFLDPGLTHEVNAEGPLRIIDAISTLKIEDSVKVYQASSSEMFGQAIESPQNELTPFNPASPYADSKTFAHLKCGVARENGIFIACGIMFNHESPYRGDVFVSKKICRGVAEISLGLNSQVTLGSLEPMRDWGFAGDYVQAMWAMLQHSSPEDFVVATGISRSIKDFIQAALLSAGLSGETQDYIYQDPSLFRKNELSSTVGDATKAHKLLNWEPSTTFESMIQIMVTSEIESLAESKGNP